MKHIWTVACSRAVVDKDSNNVSLQNVIEQIVINEPPRDDAVLPLQLDIMTLWSRDDYSVPTLEYSRLRFVSPSGKEIASQEIPVDLREFERSRSKLTFLALPLDEQGVYTFLMDMKKVDGKRWRNVAKVPLKVAFSDTKNFQ